jgi:hypothetical protein
MMSISNRILSVIFILSVFESESEHKYENKYDISDIRPYPIRFHPLVRGAKFNTGLHGGTGWGMLGLLRDAHLSRV